MSKEEQSGWRDEAFSRRHRQYGHNVPMLDIDFLCVEYNHFRPVAIIDYKYVITALPPFFAGEVPPTLWPIMHLANASNIPAAVVQYWPGHGFAMRAQAINGPAAKWLVGDERGIGETRSFTETEYVAALYALRGDRSMAEQIARDGSVPGRLGSRLVLGKTRPPSGS
jgi:hypothetical protein